MNEFAIGYIPGKLTESKKSHKAGWAYLRKCQLENVLQKSVHVIHDESWENYETIFLYHGMEQDGEHLNLFGGASEEAAKFYERLLLNKKFISLDIDMPDYGELCKNRLKNCDDYWAKVDWDAISNICKNIKSIKNPVKSDHLIVGDSHAFSIYKSNAMIKRLDHKTLHGALKIGLKEFLVKNINKISFYFGNIDIRHHLCRLDDPIFSLKKLLSEYEKQLLEINIPEIELVYPLPIEDESRRIPKTGYFKGAPFFGSREQRNDLVLCMKEELNKICEKNKWNLFKWPEEWYTMNPLEYAKTYMEFKQSVHLAPCFHRWNYWENKLRIGD